MQTQPRLSIREDRAHTPILFGQQKFATHTFSGSDSHSHTFTGTAADHTHSASCFASAESSLQPYVALHFLMYLV